MNSFFQLINYYKLIIKIILFEDNIALLSSPLQLICFLEFKNYNFDNQINYKKTYIFISNSYNQEIKKILNINKKFNKNENQIININFFFPKLIVLIFMNIRSFFLNQIKNLIVANYQNPFFSRFFDKSNKVFILDDGFNVFANNDKTFLKQKNFFIFSILDSKLFLKNKKIIANNFSFFKNKIKKKLKIKNTLLIIGLPFVEMNYLSEEQCISFLKIIVSKYKKFKIYYYPHPLEQYNYYKKYKFFNVINSKLTLELFLINNNFLPKKIVGFNSVCFKTLKMLFGNKINFLNYQFRPSKVNIFNNKNYIHNKIKNKKVHLYIKEKLNIKTKVINL